MGIEGLLRNLQPILLESDSIDPRNRNVSLSLSQNSSGKKKVKSQSVHNIREFVNCSVAIDASSWLHKAGYSISEALVEAAEKEPSGDWQRNYPNIVSTLTNYIVKRCDELFQYAGIAHITLVYDGERRCPLKMETNDCRNSKRQANLAKARLLQSQGRQKEASELYRTCVKVPFSLSMTVMHKVRAKNRKLAGVVAPFEADAQLAKLCLDGACQAVITEDSDLLVYSAAIGVPFPIIFKLDRNTGTCDVISMRWLFPPPPTVSEFSLHQEKENISPKFFDTYQTTLKRELKLSQYLQSFQLKENAIPGYGRRLFVQACVLAGCDYTVNSALAPDGIGFVTACKLIAAHAHRPHEERFHHALREWKGKGSNADTSATLESYEELLAKSEAVFYYHYVRCNNSPVAVPLQKTSSFVSPPDHECCTISDIEKYHVQLPNLHRFHGSTSFLGHSEISFNELASPPKRFQSTEANLKGWISKRSDFLCNSPKESRCKPKTQQKASDPPIRNNRAVLQEITHMSSKACSRLNFKKSPVRSKEEVKVKESEDDSIDSFFTSMNWRHNGVRASKTETSLPLSSPVSPRKRRRLLSPKKATSRLSQSQNRFIVFAHEPEKRPPFSLPTINPTAVTSLQKYDSCCSRQNSIDDDPVQVSVPPKPSKQSCFNNTTGHIDLYESQLIGSSSECFPDSMDDGKEVLSPCPRELEKQSISYTYPQRFPTSVPFYSMDVEEEVPSSYPRELEKSISYPHPHRLLTSVPVNSMDVEEEVPSSYPRELENKTISYPYPLRVPAGVPFNRLDTIDSPCQNSSSEDPKKLCTESIVWTDDDSDCYILEEKFIPIRGLGTITNGNETSKRKTSFDGCKLINEECASSFSFSRKRGSTNSSELCKKPKTSVSSKTARKHEVKGGIHAGKQESQNHSLISSWLQPLKRKKCRTERSIKDFFLPVVPAKSA